MVELAIILSAVAIGLSLHAVSAARRAESRPTKIAISPEPIAMEIGKLDVKEGDTIVLSFPYSVTPEQMKYARRLMSETLPPAKCLVVCNGVEVSVVKNVA